MWIQSRSMAIFYDKRTDEHVTLEARPWARQGQHHATGSHSVPKRVNVVRTHALH